MRTRLNPSLRDAVEATAQVDEDLRSRAEIVAAIARRRAPRNTGAGADSIHAERFDGRPGYGVSWDRAHDYMRFPEFGTIYIPAQAFLRGAAAAAAASTT